MDAWIRYLISTFIIVHGLIYLSSPFWSRAAAVFKDWRGTSALLGATIPGSTLKALTSGLWVAAGFGLVGAGVFIALAQWVPGPWRLLAMGGAVFGMVSFAVFWDGQVTQLANQGAIGMTISLAVLAGAAAFPAAFT